MRIGVREYHWREVGMLIKRQYNSHSSDGTTIITMSRGKWKMVKPLSSDGNVQELAYGRGLVIKTV